MSRAGASGSPNRKTDDNDDPPFLVLKPRAKPSYKPHAKFTPEEDEALHHLVQMYGSRSWRLIGKIMPQRNSRQCRERWLNYLSPDLNIGAWTEAEDRLLWEKYEKHGPRWIFIRKFFPKRTDTMLKNRFRILRRRNRRKAGAIYMGQSPAPNVVSAVPELETFMWSHEDDEAYDISLYEEGDFEV
jgi:hypothetical protein